jgi:hypothetical protein
VLRAEGLNEDLLQRTLHNLWKVCSKKDILPESCKIRRQFSRSTDQPFSVSRYAEVWNGQPSSGEGNDGTMDVCIKAIKLKEVHKVCESSHHSLEELLDSGPQEFYGDAALWVKLNHPNILRCFGVTVDQLQIVMDWMPNGKAIEYVQAHKHADRVCLVNSFTFVT